MRVFRRLPVGSWRVHVQAQRFRHAVHHLQQPARTARNWPPHSQRQGAAKSWIFLHSLAIGFILSNHWFIIIIIIVYISVIFGLIVVIFGLISVVLINIHLILVIFGYILVIFYFISV